MKRIIVLLLFVLLMTSCDLLSDDDPELTDVNFNETYIVNPIQELDNVDFRDDYLYVTYKVGEARDVMLHQLTTATKNTGGQTLIYSSGQSETSSISHSINASITAGYQWLMGPGTASVELTIGYEWTTENSIENAVEQSISISLDSYERDQYYAIIMIGSYNVYQTMKVDPETLECIGYVVTATGVGEVSTSVASSADNDFNYEYTLEDVFLDLSLLDLGMLFQGVGTMEDPYQIDTHAQFRAMYIDLTKHYILTNDIDMTSLVNFNGIKESEFYGSLDGDGYTLSNFRLTLEFNQLNYMIQDQYIGLFQGLHGTIKNLTLNNFDYHFYAFHSNTGHLYTGLLVGYANPDSLIDNITITNSKLNINRSKSTIGGVVAVATGEIKNTYIKGTSLRGNGYIGGIAGRLSGEGHIYNCHLMASITNEVQRNSEISYYYKDSEKIAGGIVAIFDSPTLDYPLSCSTVSDTEFIKERSAYGWTRRTIVGNLVYTFEENEVCP